MRAVAANTRVGCIFLALATIAFGPAAAARDALSRVIEQGCFARHYTMSHLSAHPRQRVKAVWLSHEDGRTADGGTELTIAFQIDGTTFGSTAYCKGSRCVLEADQGAFMLQTNGSDLRLAVGSRLSVEGAHGFSPDLGRSMDDRVFRLHPADRSVCAAVTF
ncbi:hypothetical protein BJF92_14940 [Rhizobium rhizosphaerae]|uniref:Uncharacterized protein n=1 Tax=Xaviernesmea rhizosphaerae TaxID=1672749 RepID=A0A1Q9ACS8_9HYPH|nr:hypothetical protein [Xaviernesmea rhizosphaerae]OLP52699.1 hypothetical protein BJF92_14940 [Xaviernesmea rhizosphaerae]